MRRIFALSLVLLALAGCRKTEKKLTSNLAKENKVAMRPVQLFYEGADMRLAAEKREVALPENPAGAIPMVIRELLKGSANASVPRLFPEDTQLLAAYLLPNGTVLVDLGGDTLDQGWSTGAHQELMAIYSVVQTVTANFPQAKRVRFLVKGQMRETLGGHVSLSRPISVPPGVRPN